MVIHSDREAAKTIGRRCAHRDRDNLDGRRAVLLLPLPDQARYGGTIEHRHLKIHQHDVVSPAGHADECLAAIGNDVVDKSERGKLARQNLLAQGVVFDDENAPGGSRRAGLDLRPCLELRRIAEVFRDLQFAVPPLAFLGGPSLLLIEVVIRILHARLRARNRITEVQPASFLIPLMSRLCRRKKYRVVSTPGGVRGRTKRMRA